MAEWLSRRRYSMLDLVWILAAWLAVDNGYWLAAVIAVPLGWMACRYIEAQNDA